MVACRAGRHKREARRLQTWEWFVEEFVAQDHVVLENGWGASSVRLSAADCYEIRLWTVQRTCCCSHFGAYFVACTWLLCNRQS